MCVCMCVSLMGIMVCVGVCYMVWVCDLIRNLQYLLPPLAAVFESLKGILHDGSVDVRVQYMIEVMFAIRKDRFSDHPAVQQGLDLVDEEDNITHLISVEDALQSNDILSMCYDRCVT